MSINYLCKESGMLTYLYLFIPSHIDSIKCYYMVKQPFTNAKPQLNEGTQKKIDQS